MSTVLGLQRPGLFPNSRIYSTPRGEGTHGLQSNMRDYYAHPPRTQAQAGPAAPSVHAISEMDRATQALLNATVALEGRLSELHQATAPTPTLEARLSELSRAAAAAVSQALQVSQAPAVVQAPAAPAARGVTSPGGSGGPRCGPRCVVVCSHTRATHNPFLPPHDPSSVSAAPAPAAQGVTVVRAHTRTVRCHTRKSKTRADKPHTPQEIELAVMKRRVEQHKYYMKTNIPVPPFLRGIKPVHKDAYYCVDINNTFIRAKCSQDSTKFDNVKDDMRERDRLIFEARCRIVHQRMGRKRWAIVPLCALPKVD